MITTLAIDSLLIPTEAGLTFDQTYAQLRAEKLNRTADGSASLRRLWDNKLATTITGKGWIPSGFEALDTGATVTLKCAMPRHAASASTTVTLPAARRSDTDHEPVGYAVVGDHLVETPITNLAAILAGSTDDATLTAVTGATGYRVSYLPQFSALILSATSKGSNDATFEWSLEAEQV
jgi:hypothetical protein